jgi:flavodoxin I
MPISSVTFLYASTGGHTEYVVEQLVALLKERVPEVRVTVKRAEEAQPEDLTSSDVLVLGSGTWNMYGQEGQLNDRMHALLFDRCKEVDLSQTPVALISLGDDRYHFTARATEHFMRFLMDHGGKTLMMPLIIVNEPFGQEEKIGKWGERFLERMM